MDVKPSHLLIGAAAALGAWALFFRTPQASSKLKGDVAQVGDEVHVPVTSFPAGALPAALPAGAGFVSVKVSAAGKDTLDGPIVAFVIQETPTLQQVTTPPIGPMRIPRATVTTVYRAGRQVA